MAFCTNCGSQLGEDSRFCPNCGQPGGQAGAASAKTAEAAAPLEYSIQGDNLQVARIMLKPGQEIYAEAGKMVYKTANVHWETRLSGGSIGDKILGALRRTVMGESIFLTYFRSDGPGEVGFAGNYPGKITVFDLESGRSVFAQRDAFVLAESSVQLNVALVKKLGAGFLGGEGFILERLTGPGKVFIHGGGDFVEFSLNMGEVLQINTGCIVAFDESVSYDIQMVGGIKTAIFGGEGLFLATMTGPGRVIVQSMTLEKLRRELAPTRKDGDEHHPLGGVVGGILGSDD